jgi:dTDP-4-amino-4,6-dideoxygalactose transaminase
MSSSLALLGGEPVRREPFPPFPIIEEEEFDAVLEVLRSRQLSTFHSSFLGGRKVRQFEDEFARATGAGYGVACNSGTAALHMTLAAIGLEPGDEVIVPPYTFTATASAVLMAGGVPVFADVRDTDFNIDPAEVEKAITERTRAVIPVHLFGAPAAMDELLELAGAHSLRVIEDCAQAPAAELDGRKVGTMGDLATFSFQETKNMMTGEGGMVLTDDLDLAERCRAVRNHGEVLAWGERRDYRSALLGWNYRMTEIEAALGICQLARLGGFNQARIENAAYLTRQLDQARGLALPSPRSEDVHVFHIYAFRFLESEVGISRAGFLRALEAEVIPASGGDPRPLYENPVFERAGGRHLPCPVSERLCAAEAVWLAQVRPPAGIAEMDDIVSAILKVLDQREVLREWELRSDSDAQDD